MKFIKKAAALIFCLALALSVMAISASAADEPTFTVKLTLDTAATGQTATDKDNNSQYENNKSGTLVYNIELASDTAVSINSFEFVLTNPTGITADMVTVASLNRSVQASSQTTGVYTFLSDEADNDMKPSGAADNYTVIGTVTYTFTNFTPDFDFQPSLSGINLARRGVANDTIAVTGTVTGTSVKINPKYTVTLVPKTNAETTNLIMNGTSILMDYYYSDGLGTYGSNGTFTATNVATLDTVNAYASEGKWKLTGLPAKYYGWTENQEVTENTNISSGNLGNVTLEAVYTAITYNYTIKNYSEGAYSESDTTGTYDITNVATTFSFLSNEPTKTGYDFATWTPAQPASSTHVGYGGWGTAAFAATAAAPTGNYGDVEITLQWTAKKFTITLQTQAPAEGTSVLSNATGTMQTLLYDYADGLAENQLPTPTKFAGYKFTTWTLTNIENKDSNDKTVTASGWSTEEGHNTYAPATAIAGGNIGNITLTATYTPIEYSVTWNYADDNNDKSDTVTRLTTYKITDVATAEDYFTLATNPTRPGYTFVKWTVTGETNANEEADSVTYNTTALAGEVAPNTGKSFEGAYGNVTFTASWTTAGTAVVTDYAYAGANNVLVLFAVKASDVVGTYAYSDGAMYKVDTAKYLGEFTGSSYTTSDSIFAYITTSLGTDKTGDDYRPNIEVTKHATNRNATIDYDGNVLNDNIINAGDSGNALTMLDTANDNFSAISMVSRLKADMGVKTGENAEKLAKYGSIDDAKEIAALAGKTVTAYSEI